MRRKYPFYNLEISEYVVIPWENPPGQRRAEPQRIRNAICQLQRRLNVKFETHETPAGLKVTRVF